MTNEEIFKLMQSDKAVRRAIVKRSHKLFFYYYFSHYADFPIAPFHEELFKITETLDVPMFVVSAFRNSGKSTILTLSYIIWAIISGKIKYTLIISENQQKAQALLSHIKYEFENNPLLKQDLGPFQEERIGWNAVSLELKNYGAKITAVSTEQSVRGLRHKNHRPDLIILDDCESQDSVRTVEGRDKLYHWLGADVIPAGNSNTKLLVIGSVLHPDSLIPRLQKKIDDGNINGIYRMYPIFDEQGNPTWPGKFPTIESVEQEKARGIPDREWAIEYMLQPILDENQVIKPEWIQYYDHIPSEHISDFRYYASGVDLAISEKETADSTAIVSGAIYQKADEKSVLYVLPWPINQKMNGPEIQDTIVNKSLTLGNGQPTVVYIEDVGFQKSMIDFVKQKGIPAEGVSVAGNDKRARMMSISELIKSGRVLFPKIGCEKLIKQLVYFGMEKHDDLSDALVILVLKFFEREDTPSLTFPRGPYTPPTQEEKTQKELENEADLKMIIEQEAGRGRIITNEQAKPILSQNRSKEYWNKEAMGQYRRMMRRY